MTEVYRQIGRKEYEAEKAPREWTPPPPRPFKIARYNTNPEDIIAAKIRKSVEREGFKRASPLAGKAKGGGQGMSMTPEQRRARMDAIKAAMRGRGPLSKGDLCNMVEGVTPAQVRRGIEFLVGAGELLVKTTRPTVYILADEDAEGE